MIDEQEKVEQPESAQRWHEPRIHSHVTDGFWPDDSHRLAYECVYCATCNQMLHCSNNECMQAWVESGLGAHCLSCFAVAAKGADASQIGLPQ